MRDDHLNGLRAKIAKMPEPEVRELLAQALFHLRCVSGSRNSFSSEALQQWKEAGLSFPTRQTQVELMHRQAAEFLARNDE